MKAIDLRQFKSEQQLQSRKTLRPLVLASASPRRAAIMQSFGLEFTVAPADIDELAVPWQTPAELAQSLAESKALVVAGLCPDAVVVAADTVVELDGASLGKPERYADAVAMLTALSGRSHFVHTGIAARYGGTTQSGVETTEVKIRNLSHQEIEAYVNSGAPMDKAGAYGIQDAEFAPAESINGSYLNVVGLPPRLLTTLLLDAGAIDAVTAESIRRKDMT